MPRISELPDLQTSPPSLAAATAAVSSGLARILPTLSLPPAERLLRLSRENRPPPPPAPTLASLAHSVSRDLLTPSLFSRESISAKSASKLWLPKPATPLPAPLLEAPPPAPPSSRPPLRRAPAPASSWGWTQEPEGRARAPSALLRARCHLGREWGRARTGPEAESH